MTIAAVILAAGAGRRLGGVAKALLGDGGSTFLERIVIAARSVHATPLVVVAAPHAAAVAAAAAALDVAVITNPTPERGMGSSVAHGFAALPAPITAAFLWPVDHPWVRASTLSALIAAGGGVPVHAGRRGHPPLVPARWFGELASRADGPGGARAVLHGRLAEVIVDDPGVVRDVDHPHDLVEVACAR